MAKIPSTPEEQYEHDHDCGVAGREHKWEWVWADGEKGRVWTNQARCSTCGKQVAMERKEGEPS